MEGDVRSNAASRRLLYGLLGDLPPLNRPIRSVPIAQTAGAHYDTETLLLDLNGTETVPAYFLKPRNAGDGPWPVVLYNHAHGYKYEIGKEEVIHGRPGQPQPPWGEVLTDEGYAVLCLDMWSFGDRRGRSETALFREVLWKGKVLWGMMVYDNLRAIDYLSTRPDVDLSRLATMGISMGSTMAWWTAALDTRVKVCVDLCCLTDYQALIDSRGLDGHGIYYFVPNLLTHFSTSDINVLIAPRPHLSLAGEYDALTPPAGLDRIDQALTQTYAAAGAPSAWQLKRYPVGHGETAEMRFEAVTFLRRWL
jgi:dienelactone hydrolase